MRIAFLSLVLTILTSTSLGAQAQEHATQFGTDSYAALGAYRGLVEEHTLGVLGALRIIADTTEAKSSKEAEYRPLLAQLSQDLSTDATVWYALPDGRYYATESQGMAGENLKDREYFPTLMSGKEVLGNLVISKSTGHRAVIIAVPVLVDGKTVGAVGVSLRVRLLSELVDQRLSLPADAYFYALTRSDNRIVLHRKAERMFRTPSDVGDEALGDEFKRVMLRDRGTFEYSLHGMGVTAIFECSKTVPWCFFIAKTRSK